VHIDSVCPGYAPLLQRLPLADTLAHTEDEQHCRSGQQKYLETQQQGNETKQ
jgi:hypothetical protein